MSRYSYAAVMNVVVLGLFAIGAQAQDAGDAPAEDPAPATAEVPEVVKVFSLEHANAKEMQRIVGDLFVGLASRQSRFARGRGWGGGIRTSFDPRTNSLIVVGPKGDLAAVGSLVERLDTPTPRGRRNVPNGNTVSRSRRPAAVTGTRVRVQAGSLKGTPLEVVSVVAAGKRVKKGDLLLAINAAPLEAAIHAQQIEVEQVRAAINQSEASLANTLVQQESQVAEAKLQVDLAKIELTEYQEGTRPLQLKVHETEVKQAKRQLDVQERLIEAGKADAKSLDVARAELEVAETKLQVFQKFTALKMVRQLESAIASANLNSQRIRRQKEEGMKAAEAVLASRRTQLDFEVNELKRLQRDVAKRRIVAPHDGVVSTAGLSPIREGSQVREGQVVLILIPNEGVDSTDQ